MSEPEIIVGFRFGDGIGEIRVMAIAEGYAMCRRPRAVPFVRSIKDIQAFIKAQSAGVGDEPTK